MESRDEAAPSHRTWETPARSRRRFPQLPQPLLLEKESPRQRRSKTTLRLTRLITNSKGGIISWPTGGKVGWPLTVAAYTGRVTAYTSCVTAYTDRVTAYTGCVAVYTGRVTTYTGRVTAQIGRVTARMGRFASKLKRSHRHSVADRPLATWVREHCHAETRRARSWFLRVPRVSA